jgi:hypothetical protein
MTHSLTYVLGVWRNLLVRTQETGESKVIISKVYNISLIIIDDLL